MNREKTRTNKGENRANSPAQKGAILECKTRRKRMVSSLQQGVEGKREALISIIR